MAKRLLVELLEGVCGQWVDGLSSERLKLQVRAAFRSAQVYDFEGPTGVPFLLQLWSGKLELVHLKLRENAFQELLQLPIVHPKPRGLTERDECEKPRARGVCRCR